MRPLLLMLAASVITFAGCKKVKEAVLEQTALDMLDGTQWKVTYYANGSVNMSNNFNNYIFRFNRNLSVDAFRDNVVVASGTYKGDIANRTIFASFPNGTTPPLPMLNATWSITKSTMTSLTATAVVNSKASELKMEKQ